MKLTKVFLNRKGACSEGLDWFLEQEETDLNKVCDKLLVENHFQWANWLVTRCFRTQAQKVAYAIFAAEQVIRIYEARYPEDKRPREAINAAKAYLVNPSVKTKNAAYAATAAAYAAANAAATAAYAAAYAAANAAYAAANAAYAAANAAAYAAKVSPDVKTAIVQYGLKLIKENK